MEPRRKSKPIRIGQVTIGGDAPITVQSMTKTDTRDVKATTRQINELTAIGCELIRLAAPDTVATAALAEIKKGSTIPLIADIHFDYRLALAAIEHGADGLRLNPGNISRAEDIRKVVAAAKERQIPIRIGVNAGSLPPAAEPGLTVAQRMVTAALSQIKLLEELDFGLIKVSLKAFDVPTTIAAYREIATKIDYPLHLGVTEAGLPPAGIIRSAAGIGTLLYLGIGDTIRVSLSAPPQEEVTAAYEILKSLNRRQRGPVLVSCPGCGRTEADITALAGELHEKISRLTKPIRVAVMGCMVNGPGEAKDADIGIACGKGKAILFAKGRQIDIIEEPDYITRLLEEIERL